MLIQSTSKYLLKKVRAKSKMFEYDVPEDYHINVEGNASDLLLIAIGAIGDCTANILRAGNVEDLASSKNELEFSSKFFDSFLTSEIDAGYDEYYLLLGAIAYYLCDYIGSSKVLVGKINIEHLNLKVNGLDAVLYVLLNDNRNIPSDKVENSLYKSQISAFLVVLKEFENTGHVKSLDIVKEFRSTVYELGTPLELLIIDALLAIFILKLNYSAINLLPQYTGLESGEWNNAVISGKLIRELWPAQRKIGEEGVYSGRSAVIQMPTSSGKTKAISLIIYSAFLSKRTDLVVIVAPFRALCREISGDMKHDFKFDKSIKINELSDVLVLEDLQFTANTKSCLILTPEKLIYLIRQRPDIIDSIGLIVFDEAHLFDDLSRGATYELLVSTIKKIANDSLQKVLISAIVPNSAQISNWINGDNGVVIADNTIKSTERTIAMSDWEVFDNEKTGYLYFINPENPEDEEFYVPRIIHIAQISKLNRERNARTFPQLDNKGNVQNNDVAIYYALKLCDNGAVAIFCGAKNTANNILKRILDLKERDYDISIIKSMSDEEEITRICNLISANYGEENIFYTAGCEGAFVHHAGISQGIKTSLEFAMRKELISFLACTSTLAQGVNLPIKYLIVSSIYQAGERIRTRDFHNLIGRTGRSGIYTEGSILLTEMKIYNKRTAFNNWKWKNYKDLINVSNSEECSSVLLDLIRDVQLDYNSTCNFKEAIKLLYTDRNSFEEQFNKVDNEKWLSRFRNIRTTLDAIESFLMNYLIDDKYENFNDILTILENTFAMYLATEDEKEDLSEIFVLICRYIVNNTENSNMRHVYSKSLQNIDVNIKIEDWVNDNLNELNSCYDILSLFQLIAPILYKFSDIRVKKKLREESSFMQIGLDWIKGVSYYDIYKNASNSLIRVIDRNRIRDINLYDIIAICDSGISYSTTLIVTAIIEIYSVRDDSNDDTINYLKDLSRQMKYGLPDSSSITLFELGFGDRFIARLLANTFLGGKIINSKEECRNALKLRKTEIAETLRQYPSVYLDRLKSM